MMMGASISLITIYIRPDNRINEQKLNINIFIYNKSNVGRYRLRKFARI